jgi:predicted nucleic acid-binding protein
MILADTSIWIEYFRTHEPVMSTLQEEVSRQNVVAVECVFGELLQGARDKRERDIIASYWKNLPQRHESGVWIEAGKLSSEKKYFAKGVGLIDAFLIAFARRYDIKIWSLDKKLNSVLGAGEKFSL